MKRRSQDEPQPVQIVLNGVARSGLCEPRLLLSDFLRDTLGATGTHVGCETGECGACTVRIDGVAQRSCLTLAVQVAGRRVDTVEGLTQAEGRLCELQQALRARFALQCGFCIPGILMTCAEMLTQRPLPSDDQIAGLLAGHLCRCTGYSEILAAVRDVLAATRRRESGLAAAASDRGDRDV